MYLNLICLFCHIIQYSVITSSSVSAWNFTHQLRTNDTHLHFLITHLGRDLLSFACVDFEGSTLLIEESSFSLRFPFWLRLGMDRHLFGLLVHMHLWHYFKEIYFKLFILQIVRKWINKKEDNWKLQIRLHDNGYFHLFLSLCCSFSVLA